ncbi:MAG: methylated-DNA--[protein]-cysteine S-methyltransferase [Candidatus Aenigmarchaeota archaeon]|nr:methylated-DNA--[protein]-cysteine S-methyltransferase [Candidatus Aenigmarchaeota archaeon]NIQ17287.1 methylated-DNA--[protein]-cysteine S-methyltransferase [Candidatus Aenigmarchaeota archaeon]NIS73148.1 methylated-DNA--[protein]-cysteine S-methyltransferase [Candidatus Aenigmarchaeota archaeon]
MVSKVYEFLKKVPRGKVTTYKELGRISKLHPRTVGLRMKNNKDPVNIPCYRVVRSNGTLGGYSAKEGVKKKILLLRRDGIEIRKGKINLKKYLFKF